MPTLTLTPDEYETMQQARRAAEAENTRLHHELVIARGQNGNQTIAELTSEVRLALVIIRFAVANLPPEMIKGWPYPELQVFAAQLRSLPDFTVADDELRGELERFGDECAKLEHQRSQRPVVSIVDADQITEMRAAVQLANASAAPK